MPARVLVVGTGLIGGSIGLGLRAAGYSVAGLDPKAATIALELGAVDDVVSTPIPADLVVIATPVGQILSVLESVVTSGAKVITDVGSVKQSIVSAADDICGSRCHFVGGHPMAGTEGEGISGARSDLFEGSTWMLTATERTDAGAFSQVNELVTALGAKSLAIDPGTHDQLVAFVSHLPYVLATILAAAADERSDARVFTAASGGFRDVTRTAGSNPSIWTDIIKANRASLLNELDEMTLRLQDFRESLQTQDWTAINTYLNRARLARSKVPLKGSRSPEQPTSVDVFIPDKAGTLAVVMSAVGLAGVNIEDVGMSHSPAGGVLRLLVDGTENAQTAVNALSVHRIKAVVVSES